MSSTSGTAVASYCVSEWTVSVNNNCVLCAGCSSVVGGLMQPAMDSAEVSHIVSVSPTEEISDVLTAWR